jgi:protease I
MRIKGKKIVIITAHEFEDVELLYTILRLSEEGADLTVATLPKDAVGHFHARPYWPDKPITGRFGSTVPFYVLEEGNRWRHVETTALKEKNFDAVVFPGGLAPDFIRCDEGVLSFTADMYRAGKLVAAICHGPQILISTDVVMGTDIVKSKKACSWLAVRDDLKNAGAEWIDAPAVTVGNVVTARCPDDLPDFCAEIIKGLE